MERWTGRVALVTGASVGIGAAICTELCKQGMQVVGCARNVEKIQQLATQLPEGGLLAVRCDLTKTADIDNLFNTIRQRFGRLDVCINNAGLAKDSSLISGKTEDWKTVLDVNVLALCICTREAIKLMRENNINDGQIIHISSIAGHVSVPGSSFYCGSKFMVRALVEGLRQELKSLNSHIRIASISPGLVKTEFLYRKFPENPSIAETRYKATESLEAEDIASLVTSILRSHPRVDINDIILRPVEQPI